MALNARAERLIELIRVRREMGLARRPRRRLPRQQWPMALAAEYAREILRFLDMAMEELEQFREEMPALLHDVRRALERLDVDEGRRAQKLVEEALQRLRGRMGADQLRQLAERLAAAVADHQWRQLSRQIKAALGVDLFARDQLLEQRVAAFADENVALIKDVSERFMAEVATLSTRAVADGRRWESVAAEIESRLGVARNRARLIAVDQVGKLYGQINKDRQQELGAVKYIWRTVGDRRVRPEHEQRDGQEFRWDDPPRDGHPGEPIRCRCYAEPVFDDILAALRE